MGWAQRANAKVYDAPKVKQEREHFKKPEHKRWWALFLERLGTPVKKERVKDKAPKVPWRKIRYRRAVR